MGEDREKDILEAYFRDSAHRTVSICTYHLHFIRRVLIFGTQQHAAALSLIDNLLTELKRLDDKMILLESRVCANGRLQHWVQKSLFEKHINERHLAFYPPGTLFRQLGVCTVAAERGLIHIMYDQARRQPKKTDHGNHTSFKTGWTNRASPRSPSITLRALLHARLKGFSTATWMQSIRTLCRYCEERLTGSLVLGRSIRLLRDFFQPQLSPHRLIPAMRIPSSLLNRP